MLGNHNDKEHQLSALDGLPAMTNRDSLATGIHVLIASRLYYCSTHYVVIPLYLACKLQLAQNAVARLLCEVSYNGHMRPMLKALHQLPISCQVKYNVLVFHECLLHTLLCFCFCCSYCTPLPLLLLLLLI